MRLVLKYFVVFLVSLSILGCSSLPGLNDVFTDKRKTYHKSQDLPALEIPPDLTVTEGEYSTAIPSDKEANTLREFERQRAAGTRQALGGAVLGGGQLAGEQWLALQGSVMDIWDELTQFWLAKGYVLDINDADLGVLETDWKESNNSKHRFKIFAELGQSDDTIIFLSSEKQEALEETWLEAMPDIKLEKEMIRKLSLHFYGTEFADTVNTISNTSPSSQPLAEIVNSGSASYISISQNFATVWRKTETVLQQAGYAIQEMNQQKGIYHFLYFKPQVEKKGLFDKLKFWQDDETETIYQLGLTAVGAKTEVFVMDENGNSEIGDNAITILMQLNKLYNQR